MSSWARCSREEQSCNRAGPTVWGRSTKISYRARGKAGTINAWLCSMWPSATRDLDWERLLDLSRKCSLPSAVGLMCHLLDSPDRILEEIVPWQEQIPPTCQRELFISILWKAQIAFLGGWQCASSLVLGSGGSVFRSTHQFIQKSWGF